jgi:hypothetical protein
VLVDRLALDDTLDDALVDGALDDGAGLVAGGPLPALVDVDGRAPEDVQPATASATITTATRRIRWPSRRCA